MMQLLTDIAALTAAFKAKDVKAIFAAFAAVMVDVGNLFKAQAAGQKFSASPTELSSLEKSIEACQAACTECTGHRATAGDVGTLDWKSLIGFFIQNVLPFLLSLFKNPQPVGPVITGG